MNSQAQYNVFCGWTAYIMQAILYSQLCTRPTTHPPSMPPTIKSVGARTLGTVYITEAYNCQRSTEVSYMAHTAAISPPMFAGRSWIAFFKAE